MKNKFKHWFAVRWNAYQSSATDAAIVAVRENIDVALGYADRLHEKRVRLAVEAITLAQQEL